MRDRRSRKPQLEALESLMLLSSGPDVLGGTAHGTFFAHTGSPSTGPVYSLFASGRVAPVGGTLLVGGFQTAGFAAHGAGGGNLLLNLKTQPGHLALRLTEVSGNVVRSAGAYVFKYKIIQAASTSHGAAGSGTLVLALKPMNTSIHGTPVSNPGFFGDATLTFS